MKKLFYFIFNHVRLKKIIGLQMYIEEEQLVQSCLKPTGSLFKVLYSKLIN